MAKVSAAEQPQDPTPIETGAPLVSAESGPSAAVQTEARVSQQSMLNTMAELSKNAKRVRVKVHNDAPVPVQINGYTWLIRENVPVEVPDFVADILDDAGYI